MRIQSVLIAALVLALPAMARAQNGGSFVVQIGSDTLSWETYTRTSKQVRGESVTRSPRTARRAYTMDLSPDGTIRRFVMTSRGLAPGSPSTPARTVMEFGADTAVFTVPRGDSSATLRVAARSGAVPFIAGIMALIEQLGRQARAAGGTCTVAYPFPSGQLPATATVTSLRGDTLVLNVDSPIGTIPPFHFTLDRKGRLTWYSGAGSVFQAEAHRVDSVDLDAASASYATRPLGPLSARDSVVARVGTADLWVDYGRPAKRGREIFGSVVPWNQVWRTGANKATQFRTSAEVVIGGVSVPAGTYSLWTLPSPAGWKFIVNKQSGQWGTEYHEEQDVVRVDARVETLPDPVEVLTIEIASTEAGAVLQVSWDSTRLSVPIRVK